MAWSYYDALHFHHTIITVYASGRCSTDRPNSIKVGLSIGLLDSEVFQLHYCCWVLC